MRQPTYALTGNLRFTRNGTVWADFLLEGLPYRLRRIEDKVGVRAAHTMLARALPGEAILLGLTADETPELIVQRMIDGVDDLDDHPAWLAECEATLASVGQFRPGSRIYWLSVPLTGHSERDKLACAARALWYSMGEALGLPRGRVPAEEILRRTDQARRIAANIPAVFRPAPTTPAQAVWLWAHMVRRGLLVDPDLPVAADTPESKYRGAFAAASIDEGALSDRPDKGVKAKIPTYDPVLKIETPWEVDNPGASYQTLSVITDTPAGGTSFPGSEFFTLAENIHVDGLPVDVDFAIVMNTRAGGEVLRRNRKALKTLNDQFHQREGELTTGRSILDVAAEALAEYSTLLESDKNEIEVGWTGLFVTAGPTKEYAIESARALSNEFASQQFRVVQPLGYQEDLWWAMVPGVPAPKVLTEFSQITTSSKFGAFVPVVAASLGDPTGPLLALLITTHVPSAVHYDVAALTERDVSNSIGVTGELGAGKSVTIKVIAGHIVDRGGQILVIDQSSLGEYAVWANALANAVVVDMTSAQWSLDPLLIFPGAKGSEQTETILRALLRLDVTDPKAVVLSKALSTEYRAEHPYHGTGGLVEHLLSDDCGLDNVTAAREIGDALQVHARRTYAAALFDNTLPPVPIDAPAIVFRTHDVELPSRDQMDKEHLYNQWAPAKQYGHTIYTHIAKLAQGIMYADQSQMSALVTDEVAHILTGADGLEIITDVVKRGRKENAAAILGDQDCNFGSPELRGLLKTRIAMRHTDAALARKALDWLGLDPDTDDLLKEYTRETAPIARPPRHSGEKPYVLPERRGEGYLRDASGAVGRVKILEPFHPERKAATYTTPNKDKDISSTRRKTLGQKV